MSILSDWTPRLEVFCFAFLLASLIAGFAYWVARSAWGVVEWSRRVFVLGALLVALRGLVQNDVASIVLYLGTLLCVSTVQTLLERSFAGETSSAKLLFARSFLAYHCSALLLASASNILFETLRTTLYRYTSGLNFLGMDYGLLAGWAITPLVISFYRFFFQSIQLRPGIDRPLHDGELSEEAAQVRPLARLDLMQSTPLKRRDKGQ